jgi:uncharacterized membrane protein
MGARAAEQVSTSKLALGSTSDEGYTPPADSPTARIQSIDFIRGMVMILMAIDHVRVYSGVPAGGPSPGIFFTRWITHFCAPAFVFLAGTSAFFNGRKLGDMRKLSRFLVTRGALLVVLELTLIKFFWTFGLDYKSLTLAGVIWMLGWCMILLGGLVRLSPKVVGWIGVVIVLVQQVFGAIGQALPDGARSVWEFIYITGADAPLGISVLYVIVPWIGVMAAGYGFGLLLERAPADRDRLFNRIGLGMTALFVVVGSALALKATGDELPPFVFRLLNQQKYPASQLYLFMTLGPAIALMPFAERFRGTMAEGVRTIGRVPMFYYLAHIPLIHVSALAVNAIRSGAAHQEWYGTAPYAQVPEGARWPLALLYLVFAIDVAVLYLACRWYARAKAERPRAWMKYI